MNNDKLNISGYIKAKRLERNLSQRQLAELSGVSNTEIWQIENGRRQKVQPYILRSIAPHLGVSYEELLKIAGYISEESAFSFSFTDEADLPEYVVAAIGFMRFAASNLNETEFQTMLQMAKSYCQTIMEAKVK
jgi:transcriptional regulator with XRE-family HTH domain